MTENDTTAAVVTGPNRMISLHPLAIVAISDHYTRIQMGGSIYPPNSKVLGLLWGKQQGLEFVITDAVELLYEIGVSKLPIITKREIVKQKNLYTKVFKDHEILGWYSVGSNVNAKVDLALHREMMKYNESPFFMLMHPSPNPDSKELPIALYESEMHMVEEEMQTIFVPCDFHLETTQAEMVTMEEVAKGINLNGSSTLDPHLASLRVSLGALNNRANSLLAFLEATKKSHVRLWVKLSIFLHLIIYDNPLCIGYLGYNLFTFF